MTRGLPFYTSDFAIKVYRRYKLFNYIINVAMWDNLIKFSYEILSWLLQTSVIFNCPADREEWKISLLCFPGCLFPLSFM